MAHIGLTGQNGGSSGLSTNHPISLAGLLLFGTDKALKDHCPGFETIIETPIETKRIHSNIVESYKQLCSSRSSLLASLYSDIPQRCIKEILMNSYVHRDYRNNSPVIIRASAQSIEFESPGALCTGLTVESLLYCAPVYRNFLLAEGARYLGLCDKVGQGINLVYETVLQKGLGFPVFESDENHFTARISIASNREFQEFLKRRASSLSQLDEIIILRYLLDHEVASFSELCAIMQRGFQSGHRILSDMANKKMIESNSSLNKEWILAPIVRNDIRYIFQDDQYNFGFDALFGE
jgi:predicted HTH transcriptional regulator